MRGEPYTPAQLTATYWADDIPPAEECVGGFLRTRAGSAYRIEAARTLPSGRIRLSATRWPPEDVPEDALIVGWEWNRR